jgi:hypothetical protein
VRSRRMSLSVVFGATILACDGGWRKTEVT